MSFFAYILKCADGSYYAGHTDDVERRLSQHDHSLFQNPYTSTRKPLELVWCADFPTREEALAYERRIKGWRRAKKEALISGNWDLLRELARPIARNTAHPELVEGRATSGQAAGSDISDAALQAWLREHLGLVEYRRIVRQNNDAVVISKFEPGFSQDLFGIVDRLPELFDDAVVEVEYRRLAAAHQVAAEAPLRTAVWREASEGLLNRLCDERGIDQHRRMLVLPGIESAQAVLDSILWSAPTLRDPFEPNAGEVDAFRDFCSDHPERDLFTRYYGELEGRRVENYCPGAPFGRRLVAQAWRICTSVR